MSGQEPSDKPASDPAAAETALSSSSNQRMKRLIARAWAALAFERIWRGLVFPLAVIGLFLCVSWAGLWLEVPHTARIVLVLLFAGLLGYSLVRLIRTAIPSRREALDRIDRVSGFSHRPASVLDDSLANAGQDPVTQALWNLHKRRAANFIGQLRSGAPSPGVTSIDRYALRAGVLVALIACAFLAGPEKYARVAAAFDWRGAGVSGNGYRLDAWIDPPPYTGKAPQLLNLSAPEAKLPDRPMAIEAPVNSTVIVRSSGGETAIDTRGALAEVIPAKSATANGPARQLSRAAGETERRLLLSGDADLALHHAGGLIGNFEIHVIADRPPSVALTEAPKSNARGSLTLAYRLSDDYGVTSVTADFTAPKTPEGDLYTGRSLAAPAHADLSLAPGTGGLGDATTTADLSDHPWAGLRVTMTLAAKDDGGNEGKSEPVEITLPRKPFANPLARAIAEQRRDLLLRPDDKAQVGTALSALMIAPEAFGTKDSIYLGLRIASDRLSAAKNDADLVSLADYLWNMALQIENGDLSDAERDMRAAEQKLREALQRNASPEEIRKLTEELRAAMDKFVKELAQKDPNQGTDSSPNQNRGVTPKQLQSMLDQMQELAKSGNMADAQKALDQLQNILENLKSANKQNSDPRARETRRALSDLDRMSKEQQDLRDETYRQSQNEQNGQPSPRNKQRRSQSSRQQQSPDGSQDDRDAEADPTQNGRQGQGQESQDQQSEDQQSGEQLQKRQQALRNRLDQLQKRLNRMGQDEQGLDDAENAMKDAEKGLGEGGEDGQQDAVDAQGRALDSMRKGAQKLAEKLQKGQGQGQPGDGDGEGEDGSSQQSDDSGDSDPLGRPRSNSNHNPGANTPFNPMGTPAVQRAQRVLEELRRRLSDPTRPREETDYLERLLRRY